MILIPNPVARRKRIPLTPLIDVIFILIMFFLLSSTFGIWRPLDLSLNQSQSAGNASEVVAPQVPAVLIVVKPGAGEGAIELTINGKIFGVDELSGELNRLAARGAANALLMPDKNIDFQEVVRILDEARTSSLKRVSLRLP